MNIASILENKASKIPNNIVLYYKGRVLNYRDFNKRINQLANALSHNGVKQGSQICIIGQNCSEYLEILFACAKVGAIAVLINWRLTSKNITDLLSYNTYDAIFIIKNEDIYFELSKKIQSKYIIIEGHIKSIQGYENLISEFSDKFDGSGINPYDPFITFYTSGTTGKPKKIVYSHKNVFLLAISDLIEVKATQKDKYLCALPFFHITVIGCFSRIIAGSSLHIVDSFEPDTFLKTIETHRITEICLTPTMYSLLLSQLCKNLYDLSSLRGVCCLGSPLSIDLINDMYNYFGKSIYHYYGTTETGLISIMSPEQYGSDTSLLISVGSAMTGSEISILDNCNNKCKPLEIGKVYAKTYMTDNEWRFTGDVGYFNSRGYLFIVDRYDDIIISGGENISSIEIEDCIKKIPTVVDVAVVGIKNDLWGEVVKAFIVKTKESTLNEHNIIECCRSKLAPYKLPRIIEFVPNLPYNEMGKVQKQKIKI